MLDFNVLNNIILENDRVLVGVSGGADSMCLLDIVNKFKKKISFEFFAVHVNHNLRGEEAERDQKFVNEYCKRNNINLIVESVDAKTYASENQKTIEQAARELRYGVFDKLLIELKANKISHDYRRWKYMILHVRMMT